MIRRIVFDIETGSLPREDIERIADPFREASVKTGNLGLEKSIEKIQQGRESHIRKIADKAALNAEFGQVLAIGFMDDNGTSTILTGDETNILKQFWDRAAVDCHDEVNWIGFNVLEFDLPFLFRRSLLTGVSIPYSCRPDRRYWPSFFVDLMDFWKAGEWKAMISLNRFCKACGLDGKNGDGAHFQTLFEEDPDAATAYLENDLKITRNLADHLMPLMP